MKLDRIKELAGVPITESVQDDEILEEGATWDIIKNTGKLVLIFKRAMKKADALKKDITPGDTSHLPVLIKTTEEIIKYVEDEVGKLDLPEDMKKSSLASFREPVEEFLAQAKAKL